MSDPLTLSTSRAVEHFHYSKVIFKDVDKLYSCVEDIECHYEFSEDVCPSPEDYVGLINVAFRDLNECVASKKVSGTVGKVHTIVFKADQLLQEKNNYYQFIYVNKDGAILGMSTAFLLQVPGDDFTSIDDEYLIIAPSSKEHSVQFDVYQQLLVKSRKLQLENQSLMSQLKKSNDLVSKTKEECEQKLEAQEKTFAKEKQKTVIEVDNNRNEMRNLVAENKKLSEALEVTKCELQMAKDMQQNLERKLSEAEQKNERMKFIANKKFSVDELLEQLKEYETMVDALEGSKEICMQELSVQKLVKSELEKMVDKLKAEKENLTQRILEYETSFVSSYGDSLADVPP